MRLRPKTMLRVFNFSLGIVLSKNNGSSNVPLVYRMDYANLLQWITSAIAEFGHFELLAIVGIVSNLG